MKLALLFLAAIEAANNGKIYQSKFNHVRGLKIPRL